MPSAFVYAGLFAVAFIAATLFPAQSEAALGALVVQQRYSVVLLIAVATAGNTLGSCTNWALGRGIERYRDRKWFPASRAQLERAQRWFHRCGRWTLLLSWMPVVGDALTVTAGVMGEPLLPFTLIVGTSKLVRYLVVVGAVQQWLAFGR